MFPVRYELNYYKEFRRNSCLIGLPLSLHWFCRIVISIFMGEISFSSRSQRERAENGSVFLYNMVRLYPHVMIALDPQQSTSLQDEETSPKQENTGTRATILFPDTAMHKGCHVWFETLTTSYCDHYILLVFFCAMLFRDCPSIRRTDIYPPSLCHLLPLVSGYSCRPYIRVFFSEIKGFIAQRTEHFSYSCNRPWRSIGL
jgi:hypothetical protein